MGKSLFVEYVIKVGSYLGLSCGCVERKFDVSSVGFDRGGSGLLVLGSDAVEVAVVVARASALRSGVMWYWVVREEN